MYERENLLRYIRDNWSYDDYPDPAGAVHIKDVTAENFEYFKEFLPMVEEGDLFVDDDVCGTLLRPNESGFVIVGQTGG